ncbi:MAG: RNA-binding protein [Leptolyngbyaceae cyanobacterium SM2_5_2]|nr:RNA-binding protein [Leptolyngbyaceae cyanobacterium SM2_5_2]
MSIRLYVGNLSRDLQRQDFEGMFAAYNDDLVSVKLISDKKTGKCRGFGFVTVKTEEKADEIVAQLNGQMLEDSPLKVEKALPRTKADSETDSQTSSSVSSSGSGKRAKGNNNSRKASSSPAPAAAAAQPDPRWADKLEKLKEMLAAQTTVS